MRELYAGAPITIRDDLAAAHARALRHLARSGTWWNGAARTAMAAEARHAMSCRLCRRRKAALSPAATSGDHDSLGELPPTVVEIVHRVRTDPGRLSRSWFDGAIAGGISEEEYVEIVGVIAHIVALDTMAAGLGLTPVPLPEAEPGEPLRRRPVGAKPGPAWVSWIEPGDAGHAEADLYPTNRPAANIMKAMSLVPEEVRGFFDLVSHQYLSGSEMRDFSREFRAISHAQIELLAARVSALNQCLY